MQFIWRQAALTNALYYNERLQESKDTNYASAIDSLHNLGWIDLISTANCTGVYMNKLECTPANFTWVWTTAFNQTQ